ncbi:MAG: periplasmic heavy metal sensor [Chlorobiales bacterium]|nr:periplasmic heavy metal sensor [Chlorobiales bacterium]
MNFFTSKRLVTTAFVLLVLLNATLLGVLWQHKMRSQEITSGARQFDHDHFFANKLGLSESQTMSFQKLRQEHFLKVRPEMEAIALLKKQLVAESLKDTPDTQATASLIAAIGTHQAVIEQDLVQHFHRLAQLCTPEQRARLKEVLENMATRRSHGGKGRWGQNSPALKGENSRHPDGDEQHR